MQRLCPVLIQAPIFVRVCLRFVMECWSPRNSVNAIFPRTKSNVNQGLGVFFLKIAHCATNM